MEKKQDQVMDKRDEEISKTETPVSEEKTVETDEAAEHDELDGTEESSDPPVGSRRKKKFLIIGSSALLVLIIGGVIYWLYARQYESTDDAFIDGDIVQISPRVSAYVTKVHVSSNQFVHKGDLLVELNPSDLEVKLEQAKAALENARSQRGQASAQADLTKKVTSAAQQQALSNVDSARNNVDQTKYSAQAKQAQISQARAGAKTAVANLQQTRALAPQAESNLKLAQVEYERRRTLFQKGDISQQSLDQATNALQSAQSQLNSAQKQILAAQSRVDEANAAVTTAEQNYRQSVAQVATTQSQVGESQARLQDANAAPERVEVSQSQISTADAGIAASEAAVHEAELELSYTKVYAPEDGFVTKKSVEEGQLVQVGAPMMAISQSDDVWVVAKFQGNAARAYAERPAGRDQGRCLSRARLSAARSRAFRRERVRGSACCRLRMRPEITSRSSSVCRSRSSSTKSRTRHIKRLAPGMSVEPSVKVR